MPDGPNGAQHQGDAHDHTDSVAESTGRRPEVPHVTDRFIPISHIVAALARASYGHLRQLRESITEAADQKRKRRIVDYAARFRAEYIKLLVLVNWASRAEDVSMAIDLRAWLQGQKNCFDNLYGTLQFDVLPNLDSAKIKAPDISTAIDVLTTGTIAKMENSELFRSFKVRQPLGPGKILGTLRTLNSLINLRLLLHESLPSPMQRFTVASGRATFTIPNEFSVDVFFATENIDSPALQWFMIDFRFNFNDGDHVDTPMSLRLEIEAVSNSLMAKALAEGKGHLQLVDLYNFLHKYTVQYRLERLFNQFSTIGTREKGCIDLKYASAQKILVVGYWLQKRTRDNNSVMNSMTVTIVTDTASSTERILASERSVCDYNRDRLAVKMRLGEEETALDSLDISQSSAVTLLAAVIDIRVNSMLHQLQSYICHEDFAFVHKDSHIGDGKSLQIKLAEFNVLDISIDSFNGNFVLCVKSNRDGTIVRRSTPSSANLQQILNRTPTVREQAARINDFKFNFVKDSLEAAATSAAWTCCRFSPSSLNLEEFGRAFGTSDTLVSPSACVFLTRIQDGWKNTNGGSSWYIVVTIQPHGLVFWLAEFTVEETQGRWKLQWVERVSFAPGVGVVVSSGTICRTSLDRLWRLATARIISLQISRGFGDRNIDHRYTSAGEQSTWTSLDIPNICFAAEDVTRSKVPWTEPLVTVVLSHLCIEASGGAMVSFQCRKIRGHDLDLSQCGDMTVQADPASQHFHISFKAMVAQPSNLIVDLFCMKWRMIENTLGLLESAAQVELPFVSDSHTLNMSSFLYGPERTNILQIRQEPALLSDSIDLLATLGSTTTRKTNPHLRILQRLSSIATRYQTEPKVLFKLLSLTYPVLEVLNRLEQDNFTSPEFYVMVRSAEEYRLYYPQKRVALLIRARPAPKREDLPEQYRNMTEAVLWHFTDASRSSSVPVSGQERLYSCDRIFHEGLNDILRTDKTFPEGSGIGCTQDLAAQVLIEVHTTIMNHQRPPDETQPQRDPAKFPSNSQDGRPSARPPGKAKKVTTSIKSASGNTKPKSDLTGNEVIEIL